jgi:hypothetical protein
MTYKTVDLEGKEFRNLHPEKRCGKLENLLIWLAVASVSPV